MALGLSSPLHASHIFGGELMYTHIVGNTYEITLILYGDCSGQSYPNLFSSTPQIAVYDGNNAITSITLAATGTPGLEVTPVCPAEQNNTLCANPTFGTLPGVAQFIFKATYTLGWVSNNWRFIFLGNLGGNNGAGRSSAITNIAQGSGGFTTMALEATLNNVNGPNNSSMFTTIPTPFFCINILQQYNQGGIDPDGDPLSYALVPALNGGSGSVTYQSGYTFDQPMHTAPGSFFFSASNGQMTFQPDMIQNSVVVSKITETRGGVVVGSSMREMTVVVLNNCNNQGPGGSIISSSAGIVDSFNVIRICNADSALSFVISASDPDGGNIAVDVAGLNASSSFSIQNNNSSNPSITVNYVVPTPYVPGQQVFYVTYQDDGCPLSSKQTIAYTIVLDDPISASLSSNAVSCVPGNDGQILIAANSQNGTLSYSLDAATYQTISSFSGLNSGNYTVTIRDAQQCTKSYTVEVNNSEYPVIDSVQIKEISCQGANDGAVKVFVSPPTNAYQYLLSPVAGSISGDTIRNLPPGGYTLIVMTDKACSDTTSFQIIDPPKINFGEIDITPAFCQANTGRIFARSNFIEGVVYTLRPSIQINSSGIFEQLSTGIYTVSARNANGCTVDSLVIVPIDTQVLRPNLTLSHLSCRGYGIEGKAVASPTGGLPPFTILWSGSPPQSGFEATNLYYGIYTVQVTDARGCSKIEQFTINPGNCCEEVFAPDAFTPNGDGINDTWRIISTTGMDIERYAIFNRWGQKIWQAYDQRATWEGRFQDRDVDVGTYFYVLWYTCQTDGKKYIRKGQIEVIR